MFGFFYILTNSYIMICGEKMLTLERYELAQIRNERSTLRLLRETEILELIIENKPLDIIREAIKNDKELYQGLLDDFLLEQVRRDQWNRQWGFLVENLGYEVVEYPRSPEHLRESFMGDIAIDIAWTVLPPLIRGAGTYFTGGSGAVPANILASLVATGGAAYYAYYAVEAATENRKLDCFFNFLNALFSLEQAKIPVISAALATAGRAAMKIIGKFFSFIATPFKWMGNAAKTGFTKIGNTKIAQKVYQPIAEFLTSGVGRVLPESSGAIKTVGQKGEKLTEFFVGQVKKVLENDKVLQTLDPKQIASLEAILLKFEGEIAGPMAKFAEQFGTKIQGIDDILAKGASLESKELHKACHELLEVMNKASASGKVLDGVLPALNTAELDRMAAAYFAEGTGQLGKTAALAVEREIAQMTAAFGKDSLEKVAREATQSLADKGIEVFIRVGTDGNLLAKSLMGAEKPLAQFLSTELRLIGDGAAAASYYKDILTAVGKTPTYQEFLVNIGKASPEIGSKISANSGAFLQATADNFKATEAITKQYYIISKDPSIIQAAGFSGNGALKKYMTAWVKSEFPKFKSWPKLAKVFQLGIASGTGGTKGDSQSFAEVEARRAEQDRFKAKKVAKEKEGSIKSRKNQKEKEEEEFDSMRVR
jgi:hypothetical protein